jgi:hypothetical protein
MMQQSPEKGKRMKQGSPVLVLSLFALTVVGCGAARPVRTYLANRARDASGIVDIGVTVSNQPSVCVYGCAAGLFALGGGQIDGHFAGLGGSRVGWTRYYTECIGLGPWAQGRSGWGDFDLAQPQTLAFGQSGVLSWFAPAERTECRSPS